MHRSRATLALVAGVAAAIMVGSTLAFAAPRAAEDEPDVFNVAKGTAVTATSGKVVFVAKTNLATITVTCNLSIFGGKTGVGLKFKVTPPVFSDGGAAPCTDSFGFTDTFASNSTNGVWSLREKDKASDEGLPEPNATGDKMTITIPKAGLVDTNSSSPGCTVTFAPAAAATVTGTYNDAGKLTISNASIPIAFSAACPVTGTSGTTTATYTLSPGIFDQG